MSCTSRDPVNGPICRLLLAVLGHPSASGEPNVEAWLRGLVVSRQPNATPDDIDDLTASVFERILEWAHGIEGVLDPGSYAQLPGPVAPNRLLVFDGAELSVPESSAATILILTRVVRDVVRNYRRRRTRELQRMLPLDTVEEDIADTVEDDRAGAWMFDLAALVLNSSQLEVITRHYRDGRSIAEIAEQLHIAEGTIKSWLFRARKRVVEYLRGRVGQLRARSAVSNTNYRIIIEMLDRGDLSKVLAHWRTCELGELHTDPVQGALQIQNAWAREVACSGSSSKCEETVRMLAKPWLVARWRKCLHSLESDVESLCCHSPDVADSDVIERNPCRR